MCFLLGHKHLTECVEALAAHSFTGNLIRAMRCCSFELGTLELETVDILNVELNGIIEYSISDQAI